MTNIEQLYRKFLAKQCSKEEAEYLLRYFQEQPDSDEIVAMIQEQLEAETEILPSSLDDLVIERNREKLRKAIQGEPKVRRFNPRIWAIAAAAIITIIGFTVYLNFYRFDSDQVLTSEFGEDIAPGANRAYITLSNGQRLELDSNHNAISALDGKLTYEDGSELSSKEAEYATISTPIGGEYQLTLPDGTKAWLNAASSLTYPVRFTGKDRTVEIGGEVFLDVTPDTQKPFVVQIGSQRIEVLGTAFNVRNYVGNIITTLCMAKVALTNTVNEQRAVLLPGDQAVLSGNGIRVTQVNASDFTAWKDGIILIKDATLQETCAELERWYGVKFIFPAGFRNSELALNSINRTEMLSSVLSALKNSYQVDFVIKGKEVYVK